MLKPVEIRKIFEMCHSIVPVLNQQEVNNLMLVLYGATARLLKESEEVERQEANKKEGK